MQTEHRELNLPFVNEIRLKPIGLTIHRVSLTMLFSFQPKRLIQLALAKVSMEPLCCPSPLGCFHCHLPPPYHKATQNDVIFLGRDLSVQQQRGLCCTALFPLSTFKTIATGHTHICTYTHTHTHTHQSRKTTSVSQ